MHSPSSLHISVLIITYNRSLDLSDCLASLAHQTHKPTEVVVVDNGSTDNTNDIAKQFDSSLSLKYVYESCVGIPFARNRSIKEASGDVYAFIDDDCLAGPHWIETIENSLKIHPNSDVYIGYSKSYYSRPIPLTEQVYYDKWLLGQLGDVPKKKVSKSPLLFDFKNAVVKKKTIDKMPTLFSTTVPYAKGRRAGDEDIEFGLRLSKVSKQILYLPALTVEHKNSLSLTKLVQRNFFNGYANQQLANITKLDPRSVVHTTTLRQLWQIYLQYVQRLNHPFARIYLLTLVILFPIPYRLGRLLGLLRRRHYS